MNDIETFSKEEKGKRCQHEHEPYKNLPENEKQRSAEYKKRIILCKNIEVKQLFF